MDPVFARGVRKDVVAGCEVGEGDVDVAACAYFVEEGFGGEGCV